MAFQHCSENKSQILSNREKTNSTTKVKLKWLGHWYSLGKKEVLLREMAREFSLLHQDIEIELEFPHQMTGLNPTDNPYQQTIDTVVKMIQKNQWPYDIMLCDVYRYNAIGSAINNPDWGKDYLVDFKNEDWFKTSHKEEIISIPRYIEAFGNIATGVYIEGVWNLLYVSSEVESKLGIKIKSYNMNISDLTEYAKAVFDYNKTHSNDTITFISFPRKDKTPFFYQIVISALQKDSAANLEEAIQAITLTYRSIEKLAPYKPFSNEINYNNDKVLNHKKALFVFNPSWINLYWIKSNPKGESQMRPCEIPSIDNHIATTYSGRYSSIFVVPKNARNRKEAEMFMKFISSEETADKWVKYSKYPTGLKNKISYSDFGNDN